MAFTRAWLAFVALSALLVLSLAAPGPITYTKSFTVSAPGGVQCGASFAIPITDAGNPADMGNPLLNWFSSATMTNVPVTAQASIYSIGITPTIAVPSGQWNFLSASVTAGGLTGRMIPQGGFASSCGAVVADGTNNELIAITVDELTTPTTPSPFFPNGNVVTNLYPVANGGAQQLPVAGGHYYPSPLNKFDPITNPNPLWAAVPFFPAGVTLASSTVLATVNIGTGLSLYPVCWSSITLTVTVVLCPTYTLSTSFAENPPLTPYTPVGVDESYRGSFITWRQQVSSATNTDNVQVDIVTSWAKNTWSALTQAQTLTKLNTIRLDVLTVPTVGTVAQTLYTNYLGQIDQLAGLTPSIGTLWGGLSSIPSTLQGGMVAPEVSFPWDNNDQRVLEYDTHVKSIFLTIPNRASVVASRQVRVVLTGCCHPTSLYYQDGNTATPTPVISAANLPYSIEAVMTLEHPSLSNGAANPQYPRSSAELFVPPLVWLGGSADLGASPDAVAFGGFVPAYNAEAGSSYSFPITELAVSSPAGNALLQNIATTLITGLTNDPSVPRGILLTVSMLSISSLSPSGYVLPEPLTGTTARGVLTQTNANNVVISTTSYDFIALRRATNIDNSVNEGATCNYVPGSTLWDAYPKGAGGQPQGIPARTSAGTVGYTPSDLEWGFVFSQNQQCGNQLDVTMLRSGSQISQSAVLSFATSRVANTPYSALYFLATDTSQNILPVVHDAGAPVQDKPQALAGLEVLAVSQIGFPTRTVPVSQQYPSGIKYLTRERMGISYCYSRAVFKCDTTNWGTAGGSVTVTQATCVSPPNAPTMCSATGSVQWTPPPAGTRGSGTYNFLLLSVDTATGLTSFMGTTSIAAGATGSITGLTVPSATSVVTWYTQDPAGCIFSGTVQLDPANSATSVSLNNVTQPFCNGAGTPVGGSASVSIISPTPIATVSWVFTNVIAAPGQSLSANNVPVFAVGNTYTLTTPPVVGGYVTIGTPGSLTVTVAGISYVVPVTFTTNIGSTALTVSIVIGNNFIAVATPTIAVATYQWTLAGSVVPGATGPTLQLDTGGANAGQTLAVLVTTSAGCTATTSVTVPGAGAAPAVVITPTVVPPVYTDSCYSVTLALSGTNGLGAGVPLAVATRYCSQLATNYMGGTPTAANCETWSNWVNMVCPKFIGIQSTTPQLLLSNGNNSGWVLLQFQAATTAAPTAFGSATVTVPYTSANAKGSWIANNLARPPNCGTTTCAAGSLHT